VKTEAKTGALRIGNVLFSVFILGWTIGANRLALAALDSTPDACAPKTNGIVTD
jgi:hypothetical protein